MGNNRTKNITTQELLGIISDIIVNISVPIKYGKSISEPLVMAVKNLAVAEEMVEAMQTRIDYLSQFEPKEEIAEEDNKAPESDEEPVIEILGEMPIEEVPEN